MALLDNLVLRIKAEAGQAVITDDVGGVLFSDGTGTAAIFDDSAYGKVWRVTGGKKTAALSGFPNWSSISGETNTTLVSRLRVSEMMGYARFVGYGVDYNTGIFFGGNGSGVNNIIASPYGLTNPEYPCISPYTAGTVITLVLRIKKQLGGLSRNDLWVGRVGRVGTDADYNKANGAYVYDRISAFAGFDSGTATLDILNYAVFSRGLTDSEAAAVADDPLGNLYPVATGSAASFSIAQSDIFALIASGFTAQANFSLTTGSSFLLSGSSSVIGSFSTLPMRNNTGAVWANATGIAVNVYHLTTGVLVARKTGLTSDANGVVTVSDSAIVPGVTYAYEPVLTTARRLPVALAA